MVALAVAALLVTISLAAVAVWQRSVAVDQRNQADSRALAAAALSQLDMDPERALLLASEAWSHAPTSQAAGALRSSLQRSRVRLAVQAHEAAFSGVVWSADGRTIVGSSRDGTVKAWDAATGAPRGASTCTRARSKAWSGPTPAWPSRRRARP